VPYTWTRADGLVGFGIPVPIGSSKIGVCDVSADGSVLVGVSRVGSTMHATAWSRQGELLWMETSPSLAFGVSADGHTTFGSLNAGRVGMPWGWEDGIGTSLYDSAALPLGEDFVFGQAFGTSADASVVVGWGKFTGTNFPSVPPNLRVDLGFRWDAANSLVPLPSLPQHSAHYAYGISADGQIIVGAQRRRDAVAFQSGGWIGSIEVESVQAVKWIGSKEVVGLGDLPGGEVSSCAISASGDGRVIVGYGTTELGREAVIWQDDSGPINLRELLIAQGMDLTGWKLREARDVSADGLVIVGNGINPEGTEEAWRVSFRDEEPPVIVEASASSNVLWPPNHKMNLITLDALVADDSGEAAWGVAGIECNEPGADKDMQVIDDHTVNLRATRTGQGAGRVYTIWLQAIDAAENLSVPFPVTVTVPHDQRGKSK